jgi:hypothetical protein
MVAAMETLERWLRSRPLRVSLLLAAVVCLLLSADGIVSEDAMPFGDGEHYVMRALTLYGFLHTGQWAQFWDVFTLPKQSLAPLHYWLFFLLPQSWAGFSAYGVIQVVSTYALMAFAAWKLCRTLNRPVWTPAFFLLCASQNISLDYSFFYFADIPFMATGMLSLAWQLRAWKNPGWKNGLLSGLGLGLAYWVKPPNALIFTATFFIAEVARLIITWRVKPEPWPVRLAALGRHALALAAGFVPVAFAALACGGFQSIIRLIDVNEVSDLFATTLQCTGLLRSFYFPLCLTFFYHTAAIAVIFALAGVLALKLHQRKKPEATSAAPEKFPMPLLLPQIIACLVLGEFFSFGEESKGMRSLLLVLPIMWLGIFWVLEKWKMQPGVIFLAAMAYVFCAYSQIFNNTFGTTDVPTEGYQLTGDWLGRLPQAHYAGESRIEFTRHVVDLVHQAVPGGGRIAVGSEMIYLTSESLAWTADHELALEGKASPYRFENFLSNDGRYCRSALVGSQGVLIYLHPSLQYSRPVLKSSNDLIQFSVRTWLPGGTVQMLPLRDDTGWIWGGFIVPKSPLTDAQVTQALKATGAGELSPDVEFNQPPVDQRLSWQDCLRILTDWRKKRLGF